MQVWKHETKNTELHLAGEGKITLQDLLSIIPPCKAAQRV